MPPLDLVLASTNRGKLREIAAVLDLPGLRLLSIADFVPGFDVEETGATFLENARLKAVAAFERTGLPSVADDSGLCVHGLGLEPGIRSSRYAGERCSDPQRIAFLLARMNHLSGDGRKAFFNCTLFAVLPATLAADHPSVTILANDRFANDRFLGVTASGQLHGRIGFETRGAHGFGYDPVFLPDGFAGLTLAELPLEQKNRVSHRGQAFANLAALLRLTIAASTPA